MTAEKPAKTQDRHQTRLVGLWASTEDRMKLERLQRTLGVEHRSEVLRRAIHLAYRMIVEGRDA